MKGLIADIFNIMPGSFTKKTADGQDSTNYQAMILSMSTTIVLGSGSTQVVVHSPIGIKVARNASQLATVGYFNERIER